MPHLFLLIFIAAFYGAVLGSFVTAVVYRTRHGQSWIVDTKSNSYRSQCPSCHHVLGVRNLIPIVSWLYQRGHCSYCQGKIPLAYLLTEISMALVSIFFLMVIGFSVIYFVVIGTATFFLAQGILFFRHKHVSPLLITLILIGICVATLLQW